MQFLNFFYFLTKTWTIILNSLNFFPFSKNVDYHMQFTNSLYFLTKTWTIICNLWNFFPCSKKVGYHMQFLKFLSLLQICEIFKFLSLLQKRGLSYAISLISFPYPKIWTIISIF